MQNVGLKKTANGRIGRDKILGNFTCHTSNVQSTIDYAIVLMELFPILLIIMLMFLINVCRMCIALFV